MSLCYIAASKKKCGQKEQEGIAAASLTAWHITEDSQTTEAFLAFAATNGLIRFYDKERLRSISKKKWPFTAYAVAMLSATGEYPYPLVYFTSFCQIFLSFSFNFMIHSACPFI